MKAQQQLIITINNSLNGYQKKEQQILQWLQKVTPVIMKKQKIYAGLKIQDHNFLSKFEWAENENGGYKETFEYNQSWEGVFPDQTRRMIIDINIPVF